MLIVIFRVFYGVKVGFRVIFLKVGAIVWIWRFVIILGGGVIS
jgi:hypothetical protein